MALLFTSHSSLFLAAKASAGTRTSDLSLRRNFDSLSFSSQLPHRRLKSLRLIPRSSLSDSDPESEEPPIPNPFAKPDSGDSGPNFPRITDEWGERYAPEAEAVSKLADADPARLEDEWEEEIRDVIEEFTGGGGGEENADAGNGSPTHDRLGDLKRCLVDTVYGTEFGFRAGSEVRAEVQELVSQLEAMNPTPAPVEAPELLDGNWILLYTAYSELLPLLATGATPLIKVKAISQSIDSRSFSIVNSTTLSSPFASLSFSASASFEVRSPSRIQVEFKEGTLEPPEIKSSVDLPDNVDIFGQKVSLSPLQQSLNPIQDAAANISRAISGQTPLRIPIPGQRTSSWLLITYLDTDIRISKGDGGLFVLVKEGSPLLDQ